MASSNQRNIQYPITNANLTVISIKVKQSESCTDEDGLMDVQIDQLRDRQTFEALSDWFVGS